MKKLLAFLLILLFSANVSGVEFVHHFCGKKSQYYSFTGKKKNNKCCCKGGTKDKGCCKSKVIKVKLDGKQMLTKAFSHNKPMQAEALLPVPPIVITNAFRPKLLASVLEHFYPPPLLAESLRLHVLYGVFLI
ncbi:MAG: hypothetical protein ABI378_02185 [Chitinophagaceae bacterium]